MSAVTGTIALVLTAGLLAASSAHTQEPDRDLARCAAMTDSVGRLACFDDLARKRGAVAETRTIPPKAKDRGRWIVQEEVSKIDDSKNLLLRVSALEEVAARFGRTHRPELYVVCRENSTDLYIGFDGMFVADSGGFGRVTLRIDRQKARTISMRESTDNQALGLWGGGSSIPLIKQLMTGKTLFVQAIPFNESPVTFEFPIAGLDVAIEPARKSCGW